MERYQLCPECGVNCGKKTLSERVHKCPDCGYEQDRECDSFSLNTLS
nr:transposase [Dactylococcopsis salina]